jgi:hypothetical protein
MSCVKDANILEVGDYPLNECLRRDFGGGRPADGALKPQLWVLRLCTVEEGQSYSTLNIDTYSTYPPSLICRLLPYDTVLTFACSLYCSLKLIYRCWSFCEKAYKLRNNRHSFLRSSKLNLTSTASHCDIFTSIYLPGTRKRIAEGT